MSDAPTIETRGPSAPCVMLLGEPGNGKTFSLATLAAHDHIEKLFYLYTDPGGDESLIDAMEHYNVPMDKLHWKYIPPASQGWDALEDLVTKINMRDYKSLADMKQGISKQDHRQLYEVVAALADFKCQRTGKSYGPVDEFPDTYALVFDSLTGLNKMAREAVVGAKPTLHMGEWGVAMSAEENLIRKFCADVKCPRVMIGHLDKLMDETLGRMTLQVSLLGSKLAPQIPHLFSDVVYAAKDGGNFLWSTTDTRISLKTRNLPLSDKLDPDFRVILDKWLRRRELMQPTQNAEPGEEKEAQSNG